MGLAKERQHKLDETVKAYVLVREAAELASWIKDKENYAEVEDVGEDLEQVEVLQKKFDDFQSDLKANEVRLAEMNEIAVQLMSIGQTEAAVKIQTQIEVSKHLSAKRFLQVTQLTTRIMHYSFSGFEPKMGFASTIDFGASCSAWISP